MKNTGVVWCPSIPTDWNLEKVKNNFYISKVKAAIPNPIVLKLARAGVQVRDISNNEGQLAVSYDDYNPVRYGDLLLNPMDLYSGANCNMSEIEGVISPAYANLRKLKELNPKYYDYYFKIQYWTMAVYTRLTHAI
jgi:type I restriction enzyme S subunit